MGIASLVGAVVGAEVDASVAVPFGAFREHFAGHSYAFASDDVFEKEMEAMWPAIARYASSSSANNVTVRVTHRDGSQVRGVLRLSRSRASFAPSFDALRRASPRASLRVLRSFLPHDALTRCRTHPSTRGPATLRAQTVETLPPTAAADVEDAAVLAGRLIGQGVWDVVSVTAC